MSRTIQGGALTSVSATQISEFRSCKRKWRLNKVEHVPQPRTGPQEEGERIHTVMQRYYEEGVVPDHPAALALVESDEVPKPADHLLVEQPRDYGMGISLAGVPVKGRVDLVDPYYAILCDPRLYNTVGIYDWKSSGAKGPGFPYALTPEDLSRDVQGVLYSHWAMTKWPQTESTTFSHGYISTLPGSTKHKLVTSEPMHLGYVAARVGELEDTVMEMKAVAALPSWEEATPTWSACSKYRGCPYRDICSGAVDIAGNLLDGSTSGAGVWASLFGTEGDGMGADLGKKLAARRGGDAVATGINPPDAAPPVISALPVILAAELAAASPTPTPVPAAATASVPGLHLYVGCVPTRGVTGVVYLVDEIARRSVDIIAEARTAPDKALAAAAARAVDVRELPFGTGTAALVASFRRHPPTGYVAASNVGLGAQVVEVLEPLATTVTRAL